MLPPRFRLPAALLLALAAPGARAQFAETVPAGATIPGPEQGPAPLIVLPGVRSGDSDWFTIVAPDGPAASFLQRTASAVEFTLRNELEMGGDWASPRSYVLVSEGRTPGKSGYWTERERDSDRVNAVIAWDKNTPEADSWRSVTRAALSRWLYKTQGAEAARLLPRWLEWALAENARKVDDQFNESRLRRDAGSLPLPLSRLLSPEPPPAAESARFAAQSYWLLQWIKAESGRPAAAREKLLALTATDQPLYQLSRLKPDDISSEADLELWWAVGFGSVSARPERAIMEAEESRDVVIRATLFDVNDGNGDLQINLVDLWNAKRTPATDLLVLARIRALKFEIMRVNPLYQNPLISLGRTLEAFLSRDVKKLEADYRLFVDDFQTSEQLNAMADTALQKADEEELRKRAQAPSVPAGK